MSDRSKLSYDEKMAQSRRQFFVDAAVAAERDGKPVPENLPADLALGAILRMRVEGLAEESDEWSTSMAATLTALLDEPEVLIELYNEVRAIDAIAASWPGSTGLRPPDLRRFVRTGKV